LTKPGELTFGTGRVDEKKKLYYHYLRGESMANTLDRIDMQVLPEEARAILKEFYLFLVDRYKTSKVEKNQEMDRITIIEELLPKKVRNFVPLKRDEIHGR
jgi:hypothetical protein